MIASIDQGAMAIAKSMAMIFFDSSDDVMINETAPGEYEAYRDNIS